MKRITRSLLCFSFLICLSSCQGSFSLWGANRELAFTKEGHYSLKEGSESLKGHVFDRYVLAYSSQAKHFSNRVWKFDYEERHYDSACRCGYRMSYDALTFERKEEGMSLISYKRALTGYDLSSHAIKSSGVAYKTVDLPYFFPSTYDGEEVACLGEKAFCNETAAKTCLYQGNENAFPSVKILKERAFCQSNVVFSSLYFPNVTSVGTEAFKESGVKNLAFGEKLVDLSAASQPFAYSNLETVDLRESKLEDIPEGCFKSSKDLRSVLLPDTLKTLGQCAFEYCDNLKSMVVPASLETRMTIDIFSRAYTSDRYIPVRYFLYKGSAEQAQGIFPSEIESRVYFYSEEEPGESGSYWHYADGKPVVYGMEEEEA